MELGKCSTPPPLPLTEAVILRTDNTMAKIKWKTLHRHLRTDIRIAKIKWTKHYTDISEQTIQWPK